MALNYITLQRLGLILVGELWSCMLWGVAKNLKKLREREKTENHKEKKRYKQTRV